MSDIFYRCQLQEAFEAAKIFFTDIYKISFPIDRHVFIKKSISDLEPELNNVIKQVEDCRKKNNVAHCEFCSQNANCKTR